MILPTASSGVEQSGPTRSKPLLESIEERYNGPEPSSLLFLVGVVAHDDEDLRSARLRRARPSPATIVSGGRYFSPVIISPAGDGLSVGSNAGSTTKPVIEKTACAFPMLKRQRFIRSIPHTKKPFISD